MSHSADATIVITTRNRSGDLRRALRSAVAQEGNVEVMVIDDASTDDTPQMVAKEFPSVRLVRRSERSGYIVLRNLGVELASGPVVFSIDDDAEFTSSTTVLEALQYFDHPRVGALALPFINCVRGEYRPQVLPSASDEQFWCVPHFIGTAHVLVRDLFLKLGGYSNSLIHWGEEEEYSRKLWGAGYVVRTTSTPPIIHYPSSVGRSEWRRRKLIWRNRYLMELWYTPARHLPLGIVRASGRWGKLMIKPGNWKSKCLDTIALLQGFGAAITHLPKRSPLSVKAYRVYLQVRGAKSLLLADIEGKMPAPRFGAVEIDRPPFEPKQ